MDISETTLPGVGKKHELKLKSGELAIVLTHNSGKRELLKKENADADPDRLLELTNQEARNLGSVLEGAFFQPVESGGDETMFADDMMIDWLDITEDSPAVGRDVTTVIPDELTVLAIHRNDTLISGSPPESSLEPGDTIILAGQQDAIREFEKHLTDEE